MIQLKGVQKRYGSVHALRGVDISVKEGEFAVLIGPSGCGKTTALKTVNRLVAPTQGRVFVGGKDVSQLNAVDLRRDMGYVIQETGLFPHMTIADNIALVPRLKKWSKARRNERVDELLHLVGLDPEIYRNRFPRHLSGGQRQRAGVARAMASDPPIILMDEPFGATDPITRKQLQQELVRIKDQVQKTILFVTHDISEAFLLGDTICLLKEGEVVQHATPEEMLRRPADPFVEAFIGDEAILRQFEYLEMGEITSTALPSFKGDTPAQKVVERLVNQGADTAAVIDDEGKLVGMVTLSHAVDAQHKNSAVKEVAVAHTNTARDDELVRECFPRLYVNTNGENGQGDDASAQNGIGLVIVDAANRPQGIVSYGDVVRLVAGLVSGSAVDGEREGASRMAQATDTNGVNHGLLSTNARAQSAAASDVRERAVGR